MSSGYRPGLSDRSPREKQSARYDALANMIAKFSQGRYTTEGIRKSAARSHLISKDGTPRTDRINKFLTSRGIKPPKWDRPDEAWEHVVDEDSP